MSAQSMLTTVGSNTAPPNGPPDPDLFLQMQSDLHDLCQPLTALQFRLETSKLIGGCEALQEAVDGSLLETRRLFEAIRHMRSHLLSHEVKKM